MSIWRVLSNHHLPCGCRAGVYEQYDGGIVGILDVHGDTCAERRHVPGLVVPLVYPASSEVLRTAATATTPLNPTSPTRLGNT